MTDRPRDPLANTTRLVVDGSNLLHALSRGDQPQPPAALIGRLRAIIPAATAIEWHRRAAGTRAPRRAHRVGSARSLLRRPSADSVILSLADDLRATAGPEATDELLVVTDDRDLRGRLRTKGARTAGAAWLIGRLERGKRWRRRPETGVRHGARQAMRTRTGPAGSPVAARRQSAARRVDPGNSTSRERNRPGRRLHGTRCCGCRGQRSESG